MANILLLETSTSRCSAALAVNGKVVAHRETEEPKAHAAMLCPFVKEIMQEAALPFGNIDAVAVSGGPGSYTGLRVGVSTAKGLCFGAEKPLVSVDTLEVLAWQAIEGGFAPDGAVIVPMIDARRMEVYTKSFSSRGEALSECEAVILDENSFAGRFDRGETLVFIGDGAGKYKFFLESVSSPYLEKSVFIECCPDASGMVRPAFRKFVAGDFESSAYYEPFYLKEFVAGISRKSVL